MSTYIISLFLQTRNCIKASDLPTVGNYRGTIACLKRKLKEYFRRTPVYGQVNKRQIKHFKGIRNGIPSSFMDLSTRFRGSQLYVVAESLGISDEQRRISTIKKWTDLNTGYRGCIYRNSGYPTSRNGYGYGGVVLVARGLKSLIMVHESKRKTKGTSLFKSYSSLPSGRERLGQIIKINIENPNHLNERILSLVSSYDMLEAAYIKIKSKPGNMTKGVDGKTLDGVNVDWLKSLSRDVGSGSYNPYLVRRLMIPKRKGRRPLGIPSPRDKIVQESIRTVLQSIYEPSFIACSHGFRPGRSCHTALKEVKLTFSNTTWFIEGDIEKCFDSIDHRSLSTLLERRIKDKGFMDLYWKMVKVGYMSFGKINQSDKGTPQGSVVSPLLSNIYLHELDNWMTRRKESFEKGTRRKANPVYTKYVRVAGGASAARRLNIPSADPLDPNFKRLRYVRYADDFLIGIIGSKTDGICLIKELKEFLHDILKLDLNLTKTKLTHTMSEKPYFLGTWVKIIPVSGFQIKKNKSGKITRVSSRPQLRFLLKLLVDRLERKGFLSAKSHTPTRQGWLVAFTPYQIVDYYNRVYMGLSNYYSFADDYSLLQRIHYILKTSCFLTLASKLRLGTKKKVYSKFGTNICIKEKEKLVGSFRPYVPHKPRFNHSVYDPMKSMEAYFSFRTKAYVLQSKNCWICGSFENIELHHVRHLRKMGNVANSDYLLRQMSTINRKQIPVCKACHISIHKGSYSGPALSEFPGI
uniref:Orf748 n=1 Tax=Pylaiella littoralis TaxID=2885 RepID=Q94YZ8_PYLLI|nr:hypothetical protein PylioMp37 [Pylaiella littoralis]CAC50849.1 orf748 [Pylaiella littoralis]